jgi:PKHD-type hydroxylase
MASSVCWEFTELPVEVIDILENDIKKFDTSIQPSLLVGDFSNTHIRSSQNTWINTSHWIGGWLWYYVSKINRANFLYDITDIDNETLQYTHYKEGQFYSWHSDTALDTYHKPQVRYASTVGRGQEEMIQSGEYVRKLSFTLQLSEPTDYRGGEVEFLDSEGQRFLAPKQRGTMIVFDSRTRHRVRKVKEGLRKSIVGWVVGPRWK